LCVLGAAGLAGAAGDGVRAARLFAAAAAQREEDATALGWAMQDQQDRLVEAVRGVLGEERFEAAWAEGRALPLVEAVAEAAALLGEAATDGTETAGGLTAGPDAPPPSPAGTGPAAGLTPRELEVLRLVVDGRADKEIAAALGMGRRTASKHVESILAKLGVSSRGAAAVAAVRHSLV
jgi:DNA-binding NarL/FixJ family response regulator